MCFSAGASFTASAVLGAGGVIALNKSKFGKQAMFAAIPLLFSVQQLFEGLLWNAIHADDLAGKDLYTVLFLLFAQVIWPTWLPLSIYKMEENPTSKKLLLAALVAGMLTSLILGLRMVFCPISVAPYDHHLHYTILSSQWISAISSVLYIIATIFPCFISTHKRMKPLALILLAALIVSAIFFRDDLISVWCYLGAIASVMIIFIIKRPVQLTVRP